MTHFDYRAGILHAEDVPLEKIAAEFSTPCYVYSRGAIEQSWLQFANPLKNSGQPHKIFYAIKANSNIAILNILSKMGAGFDVVSGGEIARVLAAGGKAQDIVFSGVGKSSAEIAQAIDLKIAAINVESEAELTRIQEIAQDKNKTINVAIRINPDIDAKTHPYISTGSKDNKFGIDHAQAIEIYTLAASMPNIIIKGITCHIGSQITTLEPFLSALEQVLKIIDALAAQNIQLEYLDIGGGLGVCYKNEQPPSAEQYVNAIVGKLKNRNIEIHFEPGRAIVANAGVLLTKVEYLKSTANNNFAIIDAAMNDLIRPALYNSYHEVVPVLVKSNSSSATKYSIVGPVCESGDFLAKDRELQITTGDLLAIKSSGAYGFGMSSNYNTRPRCAEILVDHDRVHLIRRRETIAQLLENERLINV